MHLVLPRLVRSGLLMLLAVLLLALLPQLIPGPIADPGLSLSTRRPVADVLNQALPQTAVLLVKGIGYALLPALAIGLAAGLRPGSALDRILMAPAIVLTAIPPAVVAMAGIFLFAVQQRSMPIPAAGEIGLGIAVAAWMARALREGLAGTRTEDGETNPGLAVWSTLGRVLHDRGRTTAAPPRWGLPQLL